MKMGIHRLIISLFSLTLASINMTYAAEITPGSMLSHSCAACHGTDGKSPGAIPALYGKSSEFIMQALKDFRSGTRPSTVMGRHAKGYTDEEIELIANHFGNLK